MSSPNFELSYSPSRPSELGDSLGLDKTSIEYAPDELSVRVSGQTEEIRPHVVATENRQRARLARQQARQQARQEQRFKDNQFLESVRLARQRVLQEQQLKEKQLKESNMLARRQVWEEQRLKDDQLLEGYRLAKLRDAELRKLDERQRRITQAQNGSITEALLQHKASIASYNVISLVELI